jgi:O-antigen/teichoic acid export membrane protein
MDTQRFQRLVQQLVLLGISGANAFAKLALAVYVARYLGLANLGLYGLLTGGTTIVPAALGFGLTDWIGRQIVGLKTEDAIPYMTSRMSVSVAMHAIVQPSIWIANIALGTPLPQYELFLIGAILMLEHLASDAHDMLVLRGRTYLAYILTFFHVGLWPLVVIAWGLLDPSARTFHHLLLGWLGGLTMGWTVLVAVVLAGRYWRLMRIRMSLLLGCFRPSFPFYIKDLTNIGGLYIDRYLISFFLGLDLTGVYTFFWSVSNVVHSLVFYGTVHPQIAEIVAAGRGKDRDTMQRLRQRMHIETGAWALMLATCAAITVVLLLPYIGRPLLADNLPIFAMLLITALIRVGADGYSIVLLGLHRDHAIASIGIAGAILSAVLNTMLIPVGGLYGAATAALTTATCLLTARVYLSLSPSAFRPSQS